MDARAGISIALQTFSWSIILLTVKLVQSSMSLFSFPSGRSLMIPLRINLELQINQPTSLLYNKSQVKFRTCVPRLYVTTGKFISCICNVRVNY